MSVQESRRAKLDLLLLRGVMPYAYRFDVTHRSSEIKERHAELETSGEIVRFAGRLMTKRGHGKAAFAHLKDRDGLLQIYVREDTLGSGMFAEAMDLDLGDWVGVQGTVFLTRTGEITVRVERLELLAKSLRPLPEKWHGLTDVEIRYRQRYTDLVVNDEVRQVFQARARIIRALREFLDARDFLEVETPILHAIYGGASARPFVTHHNALGMDFYMRIALELHLKRLIVGGLEKVYEVNRVFRNEGVSVKHNPEFTMLEAYWAYADYHDMMRLVEEVVAEMAMALHGTLKLTYQGQQIDLTPPWKRVSFRDAVLRETGVDILELTDLEKARAAARQLAIPEKDMVSHGKILDTIFSKFVDPKFIQPTIVFNYPIELSPLAKRIPEEPSLTYRFEAFICGMEMANAFSELNDPDDQRERFMKQVEEREAGDDEAHPLDEDFLAALEAGMPPTGGIGIGIDRLCMVLNDSASIRDVILFPHMKLAARTEAGGE